MKVFIIDDEKMITDYLSKGIEWADLGYQQVTTFNDSVEAKKQILAQQPELIVTDIRMPEVTGLDLAEMIQAKDLATKVIILSGYQEFQYAQKAIRFNTVDYLLKPIEATDLVAVIERVNKQAQDKKKRSIDFSNREVKNQLLIDYFGTMQGFIHQRLDKQNYRVQLLNQPLNDAKIQIRTKEGYVVVYEVTPENHALSGQEVDEHTMKQTFAQGFGFSYANYQYPSVLKEKITDKNWEGILELFQKAEFLTNAEYPVIIIDTLASLSNLLPQLLSQLDIIEVLEHPERLETIIEACFSELKLISQETENTLNVSIAVADQIMKYIDEKYFEEITLDQLSSMFFMHPVTISRIFKAVTGKNLKGVIIEKRLTVAEDLLSHSNLLVSEISELVGYNKTQYFIEVFKKKYGYTPQKYRRIAQLGELEHDQ